MRRVASGEVGGGRRERGRASTSLGVGTRSDVNKASLQKEKPTYSKQKMGGASQEDRRRKSRIEARVWRR